MEVTEVRFWEHTKREPDHRDSLVAFCSFTLDQQFVVKDAKIIDVGERLALFMPSRYVMDHCTACSGKNQVRAKFCNWCGAAFRSALQKLYADVAHPITPGCRKAIEEAVFEAFHPKRENEKWLGD